MFDISQLNQSSFRGVPFYTRKTDNTGGQRLSKHNFIGGGTKTESNGLKEDRFSIDCFVVGDNYIEEKQNLKDALNTIGSGTLIDKFYGELEVEVDTFSISEDREKYGIAEFKITFEKKENKPIEVVELLVVTDIQNDTFNYFEDNFKNIFGDLMNSELALEIESFLNSIDESIAFLEDSVQAVKDLKTQIGRTIAGVKAKILSVKSLAEDMQNTLSSFTEVFDLGLFGEDEQKQFSNNIQNILNNLNIDTDDEIQALINKSAFVYGATMVSILNQIAIVSLEKATFTTGDNFGSVKDDTLSIFETLENELSKLQNTNNNIDEIINLQNFSEKLKTQRSEFVFFYTQKYSGLQSLQDENLVASTDLLNYTMLKYNDINRLNEVMINNNIVDPLFVSGNLKVLDK